MDEPRPLFWEMGELVFPTSLLADIGRGILSGVAVWAMEGNEGTGLSDLSEVSRFPAAGLNGVGTGEVDVDIEEEGSTVRDFLSGTGFGAMTGAGELLNCHLSKTDALRGISFSGVA